MLEYTYQGLRTIEKDKLIKSKPFLYTTKSSNSIYFISYFNIKRKRSKYNDNGKVMLKKVVFENFSFYFYL